jgi:hypothetical protein
VNEAFSHADAYLEGLRGGAPGSSTPAADFVGAHPSARETRTVWACSTGVGGAEGTGDDGLTRPPAVAAVDPSDDETETTEPARFPSRSDRDDDWGAADADAWVPEAVLKRRREKGATFWLFKWKYVTEPTWEHESDLIDEGHQPLLAAYNAIGTKKVCACVRVDVCVCVCLLSISVRVSKRALLLTEHLCRGMLAHFRRRRRVRAAIANGVPVAVPMINETPKISPRLTPAPSGPISTNRCERTRCHHYVSSF